MIKKLLSVIFIIIGIAAAVAAVNLGLSNKDADPVLLAPPEEAKLQVVGMMDAVCAGDFAGASAYLQGQPDLGVDREATDEVGVLIWEAFCDSLSYELVGEEGPDHDKRFIVEARIGGAPISRGEGHTKKAAEQEAAYSAILQLRNGGTYVS